MALKGGILGSKLLPFLVAAAFLGTGAVFGAQYAYYETAPTWKVGDSWTFKDVATVTVTTVDETGNRSSETVTEEAFRTVKVISDKATYKGIDAYELVAIVNGKTSNPVYLTRSGTNPIAPIPIELRAGLRGDKLHYQEVPAYLWPLTPGATWTYDGYWRAEHISSGDRDFLDLAGTTFGAIHLTAVLGDWVSDEARVEAEGNGFDIATEENYWYSPALGHAVRYEIDSLIKYRFEGFTVGGEDNVPKVEVPAQNVEVLVHLVSELVTATGLEESGEAAAPYVEVLIDAPAPIDFTQTQKATFAAMTAEPLPEGARVVWTIDGTEYEGQQVEAVFKSMGAKEVSVDVFVGDRLAGSAQTVYEVFATLGLAGTHSLMGAPQEVAFEVPGTAMLTNLGYNVNLMPLTANPEDDVILADEDGDEMLLLEEMWIAAGRYAIVVDPDTAEYVNSPYEFRAEIRFPVGEMTATTPEETESLRIPGIGRLLPGPLGVDIEELAGRTLASLALPHGA